MINNLQEHYNQTDDCQSLDAVEEERERVIARAGGGERQEMRKEKTQGNYLVKRREKKLFSMAETPRCVTGAHLGARSSRMRERVR